MNNLSTNNLTSFLLGLIFWILNKTDVSIGTQTHKHKKIEIMNKKSFIIILISVVALLMIPFIAMQFTTEVSWTGIDFIIMGILLFGIAFLCEFVLRKVSKRKYKIAICLLTLITFLLIWAELAVGIFGTPFGGH